MDGHTPVRILAVDDIESNLVALEAALQGQSISVVRARSGEDALHALLEEEFALILLDVQMPDMDGFETAVAIRQRKKCSRIPIMFLTAHGASTEKVARAYAVGAVDFLTKPLDVDALRAKVQAIADLWRRIDETRREAAKEGEQRLANERQQWEVETLRARVADQERATAAEHRARVEAESANRDKDEFLATLSHELRTPLSAILGWATTLKLKGVADATVARGLNAIERNAQAQAKLIEDLLDISRVAAGKVRLELRPVQMREIVATAVEGIRTAADRKLVTLQLRMDDELPRIAADPDRLQQVLTNLLSNALKFTPSGGQVDVSVVQVEGHVRVQVKDTGVGISGDFLPQVFDRFRQGDGTTTRLHGGLGIGLSVVRQLVALHGGTIAAASEGQGRGATFTIMLPVPSTMTSEPDIARAATARAETANPQLNDIRALIVDDEADSRDLVREVLASAGAAVLAVESAESAFQAFLAWKPDVLVSDIGMPGEDGYTLMRRIRALPSGAAERLPAVALTAYVGADDIARALAAGFQSHLAKPIDPVRLVGTVAALLTRVGGHLSHA